MHYCLPTLVYQTTSFNDVISIESLLTNRTSFMDRAVPNSRATRVETLAVNFKKINPAESKIWLIFGLAVFCREFEFSAKLRLIGKFSAEIQINLNNFNRHRTLFCNVSTFLEKGVRSVSYTHLTLPTIYSV